jgi:hypothetical protein
LLPVFTHYRGKTIEGIRATMARSKKHPIEKSEHLPIRTATVEVNDMIDIGDRGKVGQALSLPRRKGFMIAQAVDSVVAEVAWRTSYEQARKTMTERQAIKFADEFVVKTQGSGFVGDLSPIQMNVFGKALTLWQTFTISHVNWLATEVFNLKKAKLTPAETAKRALTFVVGGALINTLMEDYMGIPSVLPAPIKAYMNAIEEGETVPVAVYLSLLEMLEIIPIGSNLKFESDPLGAVAQWGADLSTMAAKELPRALEGDTDAQVRLLFFAMKTSGVPGSRQIERYVKGRQRGETHFGAVMGRYTPELARKAAGKNAAETRKRNAARKGGGNSSGGMKGWSGSGKASGMKGWN